MNDWLIRMHVMLCTTEGYSTSDNINFNRGSVMHMPWKYHRLRKD
jgi:hypothetical protein